MPNTVEEIIRLREALNLARGVLQSIEFIWIESAHDTELCPWCESMSPHQGHNEDCALEWVLQKISEVLGD